MEARLGSGSSSNRVATPSKSSDLRLRVCPASGADLLVETRKLLGIERFGLENVRSLYTAARHYTRGDEAATRLIVVVDQFGRGLHAMRHGTRIAASCSPTCLRLRATRTVQWS